MSRAIIVGVGEKTAEALGSRPLTVTVIPCAGKLTRCPA